MKTFTFFELPEESKNRVVMDAYNSSCFLENIETRLVEDLLDFFIIPISAGLSMTKESNEMPKFCIEDFYFVLDKDSLDGILLKKDKKFFLWLDEDERIFVRSYEDGRFCFNLFSSHKKEKSKNLSSVQHLLKDISKNLKKRSETMIKENAELYCSSDFIGNFLDDFETVFLENGTIVW